MTGQSEEAFSAEVIPLKKSIMKNYELLNSKLLQERKIDKIILI
jgi:hypothetical protein